MKARVPIAARNAKRTKKHQMMQAESSKHVIILALIIVWGRRRGFFLEKFFSVQRTCGVEFEPGSDALKIEDVVFVTGQLDDERVRIWKRHEHKYVGVRYDV